MGNINGQLNKLKSRFQDSDFNQRNLHNQFSKNHTNKQ